ncbi:MAG: hypothetical protein ACKV2Q_18075 [Planctomycetaceae bacterium]
MNGGHDLERFLVRVLSCLFAQNAGLIERSAVEVSSLNRWDLPTSTDPACGCGNFLVVTY